MNQPPVPMKQMALDIALAPVPTLDNFVDVGNEAALAHLRLWAGNSLRSPRGWCNRKFRTSAWDSRLRRIRKSER